MQWRRPLRTFVLVVPAVLAFVFALALAGGIADAAPAPTPAPAPASSAHPLQVVLPGLLTVSVDLPKISIDILGGAGSTAAGSQVPAAPPSAAAPSPSGSAPATRAVTRPEPARSDADRTRPSRSRERAPGAGGGAGPLRAAPAGDDVVRVERPRRASATPPRPTTPQAAAEAFRGMLRTGLPTWLLAGVVALCAIGTVVVVRSAGRRSTAVHQRR